jgi:hypothetical protein
MTAQTAKAPGRSWAYFGLILGLAASVTGNVANTVLTTSTVHLGLRVPFAVVWPLFTWIGIEVLTRIEWERSFSHVATRVFLAGPVALVAAFVSYLHLHHLMVMAGEPGPAQAVGPIAVDATLFGCTVALLVTRARERNVTRAPRQTLAQRVSAVRSSLDATLVAVTTATPKVDPIGAVPAPVLSAKDLGPERPPVQVPDPEPKVPTQRTPRRTEWDVAKAVQMILDGEKDPAVAETVGIGVKMIQRTRRAVLAIRQDPHADIPQAWKVPAPVVQVIRAEVPR